MTEQIEDQVGVEKRVLRNIENGEEIFVEWDDAALYEHMDDNMVVHHMNTEWDVVYKDKSYFDFNRNRNGNGIPLIQSWSRPLVSDAAGCHPSQVKEFNENAKKAGFSGVFFSKDGSAHFSTRGQRAGYLNHMGYHDRSGGYAETKSGKDRR